VLPLWLLLALGCATAGDSEPIAKGDGDDFEPPDAGTSPDAPPPPGGELTLSHSNSMAVEPGSAFVCATTLFGVPVHHNQTSFYRVFDLAAEGVGSDFHIENVTLGIELADAGEGTSQELQVKFHTVAGSLLTTNLTFLGSGQANVTNQTGSMIQIPTQVTAPAGSQLVVELALPDGAPDRLLLPGANRSGQSGPTYFRAPTCDNPEPVDIANLNDGDGNAMHMDLVLTVAGSY
jgi:hypothetical protein